MIMSLLENLFAQGTVERLGWMLVHFLWQATAVAGLLAVLLRLLRRASANLRYAVACGALALMVVLPLITVQLVETAGPVAEAGPPPEISPPAVNEPTPMVAQRADDAPPLAPAPPLEAADLGAPVSWREKVVMALEPALPYVVLGWLVGVFGLSAWHLGGWTQLHRLKRRMTRRAEAALHTALDELAQRLGVRRAVTLLESALVEVPTVVGWLRPVILLPASALTGLSPDQLRAILAHELAHIRRYDYFANLLQTVVEILGFYHPAVWWVSTRIRVERENCCDDLAVHVCGNSLQYARALTSMEEIRHRQTDLALAANGGSLVARIARLLGRPAGDDRRFAWLPGLIALLLVAGVVIPAALVLASPDALPATLHVDSEPNDVPQAEEAQQNPAQVLIKYSLFPGVSADKVVDRETRNMLAGILSPEDLQALRETIHADPQQDVTLGTLLRTWIANRPMTPETLGVLIDVLQSRGYLPGEARPEVLANDGQQARMSFSAKELILPPTDSTSAPRPVTLGTFVQMKPHIPPRESDPIRLEIAAQWKERIDPNDSGDAPAIRQTEMETTIALPQDRCAAVVTRQTDTSDDHLYMLVLGPATIIKPQSAPGQSSDTAATTIVESPSENNMQGQDETQVSLEFVVAKALADAPLDPETMLLIGNALASEGPQIANQIAADPKRNMTLGEVLKRYVTGRSLSQETGQALLDLLRTRGFISIQSCPRVITSDGNQASIRIGSEQPVLPSPPDSNTADDTTIERIEYGLSINLTPHVGPTRFVTLDMAVEVTDPAPQAQSSDPPTVRTMAIESTMTVPEGRSSWLLTEPGAGGNAPDWDPESLLVVFRASIVKPAPVPANRATSQSRPDEKHPRPVLLDTRVVEMERSNLRNVGVEWNLPTVQNGNLDGGSDWPAGLAIGYSPDQNVTNTLIATLDHLEAARQAEIISNPQIVTLNGRPAQLRSVQAEWFLLSSPQVHGEHAQSELQKIESGTILTITPFVGNDDEITLEMTVEVSESLPRGLSADLPIVTRRQCKNRVTIRNGGTVAVAGLSKEPMGQNSRPAKEIGIFVTAHLVPADGPVVISRPVRTSEADQTVDGTSTLPSQAWTILRYPNCPPLLLGLTQQFAKVLAPSRQNGPAWRDVDGGGMLRLKVDVEGENAGEVLVGLFAEAQWLHEPVAVRRVSGPGEHVLTGLPAGRYQIGAMIGAPPVAKMLGVQRQWPEAIEIGPGRLATTEVLLSEEFQRSASGWYNQNVAKDYLGDWSELDQSRLLQGRLLGPGGTPIRFGEVQIREYKNPAQRASGIAAPNVGTSEQGDYRFDGMAWPYPVGAMWRDPMPAAFGYRSQYMRLNRVMEGPQRVDFQFKPFPAGTAKVAGRVTDQAGQPITRFFLRVTTPPMPTTRSEDMDGSYETFVTYQAPFISEDGRFELAGLPEGPAQVHPIPFDNQRYERQWGREATLAANNTTVVDFELARPNIRTLHGRVLFEDGTPAILDPAPWPGATALVQTTRNTFPLRGGVSAKLDADGCFTLELQDRDYEPLARGEHRLSIGLPNLDGRGWRPSGDFPFDKLAADKGQAGVVTVKRPLPAPTLEPELRQAGPLPQGWRLEYKPGTQRMQQVLFNAEVVDSKAPNGRPGGNEEFTIYDPEGKQVEKFKFQSMMDMGKAQQYTLIGRQIEDGGVLHGPYVLDMTRPGFYTLTVDLSAVPARGDQRIAQPM